MKNYCQTNSEDQFNKGGREYFVWQIYYTFDQQPEIGYFVNLLQVA